MRKNRKHFLIINNGGIIGATTPKDWARANQSLFQYSFSDSDNTPTVEEIEEYLINRLSFSKVDNPEVVILYKYSEI